MPSSAVGSLVTFQDDIYALQFRLSRAVDDATHDVRCGIAPGARARRLGPLLRSAAALERAIATAAAAAPRQEEGRLTEAGETGEEALPKDTSPVGANRRKEEENTHYFEQRLPEMYSRLRSTAAAAASLLEQLRDAEGDSGGLPLTCVGQAPVLQHAPPSFPPGTAAAALVFPDTWTERGAAATCVPGQPAHGRALPPAQVETIGEGHGNGAPRAEQKTRPPEPVAEEPGKPVTGPPSSEEQVVDDIKRAIEQMKQGARNISDIMSQERASLDTTEALLAAGVAKSHESMRDIGKMHDVVDADGKGGAAPRLVRALPGGTLLWRTVVAPLWAVVKQALLLCFILAVTGTTLMLIVSVGKPKRFRAHRPVHHHDEQRVSLASGMWAANPEPLDARDPLLSQERSIEVFPAEADDQQPPPQQPEMHHAGHEAAQAEQPVDNVETEPSWRDDGLHAEGRERNEPAEVLPETLTTAEVVADEGAAFAQEAAPAVMEEAVQDTAESDAAPAPIEHTAAELEEHPAPVEEHPQHEQHEQLLDASLDSVADQQPPLQPPEVHQVPDEAVPAAEPVMDAEAQMDDPIQADAAEGLARRDDGLHTEGHEGNEPAEVLPETLTTAEVVADEGAAFAQEAVPAVMEEAVQDTAESDAAPAPIEHTAAELEEHPAPVEEHPQHEQHEQLLDASLDSVADQQPPLQPPEVHQVPDEAVPAAEPVMDAEAQMDDPIQADAAEGLARRDDGLHTEGHERNEPAEVLPEALTTAEAVADEGAAFAQEAVPAVMEEATPNPAESNVAPVPMEHKEAGPEGHPPPFKDPDSAREWAEESVEDLVVQGDL